MKDADPAWSPGTAGVLRDETTRLRELAQALDDLALDLRLLAPQGWEGRACEAYVETRDALAKQCRSAAWTHELASRALDDYVEVLVELAERRRYESTGDGLARLEQQRVEAALQLERAWEQSAGELATVKTTLAELAAPVPDRPPLVPEPPKPRESSGPGSLDPRRGDRVAYRRELQGLCDAVLDHFAAC
jgi:hypothetical protein